MKSVTTPPRPAPADPHPDFEVLRPALDARDAATAPLPAPGATMAPGVASAHDPLAALRAALQARYRTGLTIDEAVVHRRLTASGRLAEARALVEQAERFFAVARRTIGQMNADELGAFSQALDEDDGPRRHRVVAGALRRLGREAAWRAHEAPLLTDPLPSTTPR